MRLLGIDPGEDVGFSFKDTKTDEDRSWQENIKNVPRPHFWLRRNLRLIRPDVILCEDFYHIPRYMKLSMITAELIGVVKLHAQEFNAELHMQNRGMKTGWPASKLQLLGLWQPGKDNEDAMDALRHRLVYEEKHGMIDWPKPK